MAWLTSDSCCDLTGDRLCLEVHFSHQRQLCHQPVVCTQVHLDLLAASDSISVYVTAIIRIVLKHETNWQIKCHQPSEEQIGTCTMLSADNLALYTRSPGCLVSLPTLCTVPEWLQAYNGLAPNHGSGQIICRTIRQTRGFNSDLDSL